jgi:TonB family protein
MRRFAIFGMVAIAVISIAIGARPGLADESGSGPESMKLPKFKLTNFDYPDSAKRLGLEGKVLIAFDISPQGRAVNASMISSDEDTLVKPALGMVLGLRFDPTDLATGDRPVRYRIGFVFCMPPSSLTEDFGVPAVPLVVSSSRMRGVPIHNLPAPGATGRCVKQQK